MSPEDGARTMALRYINDLDLGVQVTISNFADNTKFRGIVINKE